MCTRDMPNCVYHCDQHQTPDQPYSDNCEALNFVNQNRAATREDENERAYQLCNNLLTE